MIVGKKPTKIGRKLETLDGIVALDNIGAPGPVTITDIADGTKLYTIRIDRDVGPPFEHREELNAIRKATEYDFVEVILNTNGGDLDTALEFDAVLRECEAETFAILRTACHSAGSVIALACQGWEFNEYTMMLVHQPSWGVGGTDSNIANQVEKYREYHKRVIRNLYKGFLTTSEITQMLNGREYFLDYKELEKRFTKLHEQRNKGAK